MKGLINKFVSIAAFFIAFSLTAYATETIHELLAHQEQLFNLFLPQTNFATYQEVLAHLQAEFPKRMEQFDNDLVLAIFAPSNARESIIKNGLKNQFETNSSKGLLNKTARFNTERSLLNLSSKKYHDIAFTLRAKYGAVTTTSQLKEFINEMSVYGDDVYILKNTTHHRITWTPGDSLNRAQKKCSDYIFDCSSWDEMFIPWRYRHIIIPYLDKEHGRSIKIPNTSEIKAQNGFNTIIGSNAINGYMEFQIWGPVTLEDVHYLVYTTTQSDKKPTQKQLKTLKKAGVSVVSLKRLNGRQ